MTLSENGDLWCDIRTSHPAGNHPALFLDRDGTLIKLVDYLSDPASVVLIGSVLVDIRQANNDGMW